MLQQETDGGGDKGRGRAMPGVSREEGLHGGFVRAGEAARALGVSRVTVWRWARAGALRPTKRGTDRRAVWYRRDEIEALRHRMGVIE
jgi:excisionase family DNA binding protein